MGLVAFVDHSVSCWMLSIGAETFTFPEFDDAVEGARARLRREGGGMIYVGQGPGVKADSYRVGAAPPSPHPAAESAPIAAAAVAPSPPSIPPSPQAPPARTAAARDTPAEKPGIASELAALRASYERAQAKIAAIHDPIERDIGRGTLRLESAATLNQLRQNGPGLSNDELRSLSSYVESLEGGKVTETTVKAFDKAAAKVYRDIWKSLFEMTATGSVAFIFGLLIALSNSLVAAGAGFIKALASGAISAGVVWKAITSVGPAGERAFTDSWAWAKQLGFEAEQAMAGPRLIEQRLWSFQAGAVPRQHHKPLSTRAREWAQFLIVLSWIGVILGLCAFGFGIYEGWTHATASTLP